MKRGCLCLLLAVLFASLSMGAGAQETQSREQAVPQTRDDYAFRLTFFVVTKIDRTTDNPSDDPLSQAARELFAEEKQEQIRRDLERRIGRPGNPDREDKYNALLAKIDEKLSDEKIREMREELSRKGRGIVAGWPWPICVIVGCR